MITEFVECMDRRVYRIDYDYNSPGGKYYEGIYEDVGYHRVDATGFPKYFIFYDENPDGQEVEKGSPTSTIPFNGTIEEYLTSKGRDDVIKSNKRFMDEFKEMLGRLRRMKYED